MAWPSSVKIVPRTRPGPSARVHFDAGSDLDCERFRVKVEGGKQVVIQTLPPVTPIQ